jgi:transketolase
MKKNKCKILNISIQKRRRNYKLFYKIANTVRGLAVDMIETANSGHPGLPLGCAEIGAVLFKKIPTVWF